ncbi:cytochrome P450 [Trifolium medium]|uniref:Cytochrome P450 n=1 Tax=Trifolium medium TaxID=97028 RepID=A0A392Q7C3_9FABA|nr:cytochrome P450 [Trifolium medium]
MRTTHRRPAVHETELHWCKPRPGTLKCNVDAACYEEANQYCIGACLRDAEGKVIHAYMKKFEGKPEVREAEAVALLEALNWLQQYNMQQIQIETDCRLCEETS